MSDTPEENATGHETGQPVYAVSYPPAMYARDILTDRSFAMALGYEWLHDEDSEFVRAFREQVKRQAELYQQWLEGGTAEDLPAGKTGKESEQEW